LLLKNVLKLFFKLAIELASSYFLVCLAFSSSKEHVVSPLLAQTIEQFFFICIQANPQSISSFLLNLLFFRFLNNFLKFCFVSLPL